MLNGQQKAAVHYISGPLLVLAGAGSGKTRVIIQKIEYLIQACAYAPQSIYAVTFTNKAAQEMKNRLQDLLPPNMRRGLKVATFHTLGLSIIKRNLGLCGLKLGFSIFDADDCLQILRGFLPVNKANDRETLFRIQQQISLWKNGLMPQQDSLGADEDMAAQIYPRYQQALNVYNAVDFDDLIRLPVQLFDQHPEVLDFWQNKIRHLLVDEYQDSNLSQYTLVKKLVGTRAAFTVVGDDAQSIYAWRGAKPENLSQLQSDFPQLKVIKLEQNYRSTTRILQLANRLISHNPHVFEKKLWSELGAGDLIRVIYCKDELNEAEYVVGDLISHKLRSQRRFGDYALLYRGNHQSRLFEKVLKQQGIPYRVSGGQSWFSKAEVKDAFAYLKLLCNEADDAAFLRVINTPKRGIGEASLDALGRYAQTRGISLYRAADHLALQDYLSEKPLAALANFKSWFEGLKRQLENLPPLEVLKQMIEDSTYETHVYEQCDSPSKAQKTMDNVWELMDWVGRLLDKEPGSSLAEVVNKLILIDILEQSDEDHDRVNLMTLHASKGLEFPYVYMVGMEEGLLPHHASQAEIEIEEERRLAYVGITRAQKGLCFTLAQQRRREGELQDCQPSRFLDELPQECLELFAKGKVSEQQSKNLAKAHLQGLKEMLNV